MNFFREIFSRDSDKDNILDALSIYHNLPMNEKTFVRLNAEKLIDKPCKIRNNCNYT